MHFSDVRFPNRFPNYIGQFAKMAFYNIEKRPSANGITKYKCSVRVKSKGKVLYRETRTFTKSQAASAWGKKRVSEIELEGIPNQQDDMPTISELISRCFNDSLIDNNIGRSKRYGLKLIADCDIGKKRPTEVETTDIIQHCKDRISSGTGASTVATDISFLWWLLNTSKISFGYDVSDQVIVDSYSHLYKNGLIAKSQRRNRRPTELELERLKKGLKERQSHRSCCGIPYIDILDFSILSCMRIGEVCKITWEDLDEKNKAVIVRDRKDPRKKAGNHMLVPLIGGAFELVMKQPRTDERIFPYNSKSVTAGFQRVRAKLGIEDLRYHDLRREGASRLFEKGYVIDEVAQVTGHRDLNTLWLIYTELFPKRLHDKDLR